MRLFIATCITFFLVTLLLVGVSQTEEHRGVVIRSSGSVTTKPVFTPLYNKSFALLVGNSQYNAGWDPLSGAGQDIEDVARSLKNHGFQVNIQHNLTKQEFSKIFTSFVLEKGQDENNRLLFYYAGHGHTLPMATGEKLG
jgi:hypothetical protein